MARLKKLFLIFFTCLLFSDHYEKGDKPSYSLIIHEPPSEIGGREDLMGRWEYEQLLMADPKTGTIPEGIRKAEMRFTNTLVQNTSRFRKLELAVESTGPFNVGGRTRAVAFDVRDEQVILAGGVSGGIWKSMDGGQHWVRKSNPENRNSVSCIVQDKRPGRQDTWYHGTGELVGNSARGGRAPFRGDGIYKSNDNGETWHPIASTQGAAPHVFNSQFQYIWDIEVNEQNLIEDEILIAAFGGILRSTDGGDTWEVELGQPLFNLPSSVDLNMLQVSFYTALEQSSSGVFYATLSTKTSEDGDSPDAGIYISRNGREWLDISPFTADFQYRRIVIGNSESDSRISYFLIDSNPVLILKHTLHQFDNLDTIQSFNVTPISELGISNFETQGSYNMMIKVHPENPDTVFVGGINLYRSTDGFITSEKISQIGGYRFEENTSPYPNHHPDQHDLLFYPSNPNKILSASDGGVIMSQNGMADSVSWQSLNNGFVTSQFFTISQSKQVGSPILIGGMQDNGTDLTSGSDDWKGVTGGDGGYTATTKNNSFWVVSFQEGHTLRLTLNKDFLPTSFGRVDPGGLVNRSKSAYLFINPFVLDQNNQNRMFMAGGNHLYFNVNISQIPGGSQVPSALGWGKVTQIPLQKEVYSALEMSLNSQNLYFGTSHGQLFKLSNANDQRKFQVKNITSTQFPENGYISSIATNPENQNQLVVVFSNYNIPSIFESTDGGASFVDISGNLEQNRDGTGNGPSIRWTEIIPTNTGLLYLVGTSTGLFSAENIAGSSTMWRKESTGSIGSAVIPMMDYRPSDGRLAIATHGNGVFTIEIPDFKQIQLEDQGSSTFEINYAYPNPFANEVKIRYSIPEDGIVRIDLYSVKGELINDLLWSIQFAGTNEITWDGSNSSGTSVANGVYFYRIMYENQFLTGKLLLNK